jgi:methanol metabolism-related c-type cytochrome
MTIHTPRALALAALAGATLWAAAPAFADNLTAVRDEDGKYFTADDIPTFNVAADGTVDWYTFSGFRRYHAECHVCHGPDGEGSTYAPALKKSAIDMDYYDFIDVVTNGLKKVGAAEQSVMPAFGTNPNVMCYLDDIYIYLKAHGSDAIGRGRPPKKAAKPDAAREFENACMGS